MANSEVKQMGASTVTETLATSRKTGWFPFKDLDKTAIVRRLNAIYNSSDDLNIKLYADGDSVNTIWTGTMPKNGTTGTTLSSSATSSDTILDVTDTSTITPLDKILIDREIMQVEDLVTNGTFDTNTTGWDADGTATLSVNSSNQLVITSGTSGGQAATGKAIFILTTVVGKTYTVKGNFYKDTSEQGRVQVATGGTIGGGILAQTTDMTSDTEFNFTFTATTTNPYLMLHENTEQTVGDTTIWDNISVICTTQLKVTRGQTNTQAAAHTSGTTVFFGHRKWDSKRIGRRAKYLSVEISTASSKTATEISKMEIEYE